jgi:uncharacterized membrane protein YhhN
MLLMNRTSWIILFLIITAADIFAIASGNEDLRWFTKTFILPILFGFIFSSLAIIKSFVHKWVLAALVFSWIGDVLLMAEPYNSKFFIFGLISFLIAHICYIDFFQVVKKKEGVKTNLLLVLPVVVYYIALIGLLYSHLGVLKIPVIVYGAVISAMLAFALHMAFIKYKDAGGSMMLGAILFILSDSVLAINKFYQPFQYADIIIMITYAFAQLFIVLGVIKYIRKSTAG